MTNKEREQRMEELEKEMFFLNMKDNWTNKDFETRREWTAELFKLREQLKEIEQ